MDKIKELFKSLGEFKERLIKDALDEKIKTKMRTEMDRRNVGGKEIADHYRDIDETIPAAQRSNIKGSLERQNQPRPKLSIVKGEEVCKVDKNGQWSIEKSNAIKPIIDGEKVSTYDPIANIKRKATRTGEEHPELGGNQGVRQYTTSGSSVSQAHEAAQEKEQQAKSKASLRTFADMSDEEKAALKAKYEKK